MTALQTAFENALTAVLLQYTVEGDLDPVDAREPILNVLRTLDASTYPPPLEELFTKEELDQYTRGRR